MTVTILGGAGYLGSVLALQFLKLGYLVRIFDNLIYNQGATQLHLNSFRNHEFIIGDVRDEHAVKKAIKDADVVVALAALVGAPICEKNPKEAVDINRYSILRLIKLMDSSQLLIYPNTNSGYGTVADGICTEKTPMNPISVYGVSKYEAEQAVLQRKNSIAFRLATVFGVSPRMRLDLLVNSLSYEAYFTRKLMIFDPGLRRNYIHVKDVADCFTQIVQYHNMWDDVYNLGMDKCNMTKGELAKLISAKTGAIISIGEGTDPDRRDYEVSSAKLNNLGILPVYDLDYGLDELLEFYRKLPADGSVRDLLIRWMRTNI